MKKKLLVLIVVLALTAVLLVTTACSGKGMFVIDEERDFAQNAASVTFAGRNTKISKADLQAQVFQNFNENYEYYNQYGYGSSYAQWFYQQIDQVFDSTNKSMAEDEAYFLKCLNELYKIALQKDPSVASVSTIDQDYDAAARTKELEKVLEVVSKKDLIEAIEKYNEFFQKDFDTRRKSYEADKEKLIVARSADDATSVEITRAPYITEYEVGEELDTRGLIVSATYVLNGKEEVVVLDERDYTIKGFSSESIEKGQEVTVAFGDLLKDTFTVDIVAAKPSRTAKPTDEEEEEKTEVPARFEVELAEKIKTARSEDLAEHKLLVAVKERQENALAEGHVSYDFWYQRYLKQQVITCYENIIKDAAKETVTDAEVVAEYEKRKAEQDAAIVEGGAEKYASAMGEAANKQIVHDADENYFYVYNLLFNMEKDKEITSKYEALESANVANGQALDEYMKTLRDLFKVYISDPEYDADAECEAENCTCTACENYTGANPGVCRNEECTCASCKNRRFINKWFFETYGEEYGFTRNADGTINVRDVMAVIQGELGEIAEDAPIEDRIAMLDAFAEFGYLCNDDPGAFDAYAGDSLGYGIGATQSKWVAPFNALARALAYGGATPAEISDWEIKGSGVGAYGWCYTEYGIHFVMFAGFALPEAYRTDEYKLESGNYALPMDAIVDRNAYDAETGEGTIAYYIAEDLKEQKATEALNAFQKTFYHEEVTRAGVSYNSKVYQDLIKKYKVDSDEE